VLGYVTVRSLPSPHVHFSFNLRVWVPCTPAETEQILRTESGSNFYDISCTKCSPKLYKKYCRRVAAKLTPSFVLKMTVNS